MWIFLKGTIFKYWPYLLLVVSIVGTGWLVEHSLQESYDKGYDAGVTYQQGEQTKADDKEKERRDADKERLEVQAQHDLEAAKADAAFAAATANRLQSELNRIRDLAEAHTGSQPSSKATSSVIIMLANMLEDSNKAYIGTAKEADDYYNAGLMCQNQYNSLRFTNAQAEAIKSPTFNK